MAGHLDSPRFQPPAPPARPLLAWSIGNLQQLQDLLGGALEGWASAWGVPGSRRVLVSAAGADVGLHDWQAVGGRGGQPAAWLRGRAATQYLPGTRTTAATPIARQVAARCAQDRTDRLLAALMMEPVTDGMPAPGANSLERWGGAVLARGVGGWSEEEGVEMLVAADAVARLVSRPAAPVRPAPDAIDQALQGRRLVLQVRLDGCEVDLGALAQLRVGDVVRLDHGLDQPAIVTDPRGLRCFWGQLARKRGRKTLVLGPPPQGGSLS